MPLERANPISAEILEVVPTKPIEAQITELIDDVRRVDHDHMGWLRKQQELIKLRLGIRKDKNIPWPGANNVNIPLIDGIIRRWRPGIAALVLDADPIAFFTAQSNEDFDTARMVEPFFTYLFREAMETTLPTVQLVDLIAARGHAYTREAWSYRTRKQARILSSDHLFPEGVQEGVQAEIQQAQEQGQELSPMEVVVNRIVLQYDLDQEDPEEGRVLVDSADKILSGAEFVKINYREVIQDRPNWEPIDPINVITPQDSDPEFADFFVIIHEMTTDQVKAMSVDGHLRPERVEAFMQQDNPSSSGEGSAKDGMGIRQSIRDLQDSRAELTTSRSRRADSGVHTLWEIYCMLDIDGTGERQRCVLWYAPNSEMTLGLIDFPYPFRGWPVTYYAFEGARRPVDNRGLADMLREFQKLVNAAHNARLDAAQIVLAPVLFQRAGGQMDAGNINWGPGQVITLAGGGEVGLLQKGSEGLNILAGLLQQEQVDQRAAEAYVGVFDASLTNIQESKERRTATEIQAIQNLSGNIFGLDAKLFVTSLGRSFTKIWQLYEDLGAEEMFFRVTGEEKPRIVLKRDIIHNYDIRAAGSPANTNKSFQLANIERIMQIVFSNPLLIQSGRIDFAKIIDMFFKLTDYQTSRGIVRSAEESATVQKVMQAAEALDPEGGPAAPF